MRKSFVILLALLLTLSACSDSPVFPVEPEISFVSISPTSVKQFDNDTLVEITIHYQDGDGDLGYEEGSGGVAENLFVTDLRDATPDTLRLLSYSIPSLTPETRKPSIQGEITISLPPLPHSSFFVPGSTENDATFSIYLVDRAGNVSNVITTDPVTIIP